MATENKKIEGLVKSYKFQVKNGDIMIDKLEEYSKYYNIVSNWINDNLMTLTIGDIALKCNAKQSVGYMQIALSDDYKQQPMYKIFEKKYDSNHCLNLLYAYITNNNIDNYTGNSWGLRDTSYRRQGYITQVINNYRSKFANLNFKAKYSKIDINSNIEEIEKQCLYEKIRLGLNKSKDWENYIDYLKQQENINELTLNRFTTLRDYFISNEESLNERQSLLTIEQLQKFNGCQMKKKSMRINIQNFKLNEIPNSLGYKLQIHLNKVPFDIELLGNRQIRKGNKDNYTTLVDIVNNHGDNIIFKLENNKLYVILTSTDTTYNKTMTTPNKICGIDINIKHALLNTSERDSMNIQGYVNLYKRILENDDFVSLLSMEEYETFSNMASYLTFCPIEFNYLYSRISNDEYTEKERLFSKILIDIQKEYENKKGYDLEKNYIHSVNKLRAKIIAYHKLKTIYKQKRQEYDIEMGFVDNSTLSKEDMDKRRFEFPFDKTYCAIQIKSKLDNVLQDIEGCRKNIITYVYKIFETNGYDTIGLENLDNSNFEYHKPLCSIKSLLNYHKLLNKTIEQAKENNSVADLIEKDYYIFTFDENENIIDAKFSDKGNYKNNKSWFINQLAKVLHFASIKDYFITLSNYGKTQIILVPSEFTSQMNSITHKLPMVVNNKGKLVKPSKNRVRKTQEKHYNGLNADINATLNIKYIVNNENWRNVLCKTPNKKDYTNVRGYNFPILIATQSNPHNVSTQLKKLGGIEIIQ